jgi:hypothetical protein
MVKVRSRNLSPRSQLSASVRKYKDVFSGAGSEQMLTPFGSLTCLKAELLMAEGRPKGAQPKSE